MYCIGAPKLAQKTATLFISQAFRLFDLNLLHYYARKWLFCPPKFGNATQRKGGKKVE